MSHSPRSSRFATLAAIAAAASILTSAPARADEGMWLPQQVPGLAARLEAMGFEGDPAAFADLTGHPMGAVVSLGFCTAAFVSPDGLIATNHHCATGFLQYNSTPDRNLLENGFLAASRGDELSCGPGARVEVAVSIQDVTDAITADVDRALDDRSRFDLIDRRIKERVAACESGGLRCKVESFLGGAQYLEIASVELRDLRLVYAPAAGIGVFGGETDNWRWPRHTGDWTFLRAYAAQDGTPAAHSADNVPYRPTHFLRVQPRGVREGDLVFALSYPGRTQRHKTVAEVRERVDWYYPLRTRLIQEEIDILEPLAGSDPELAIKASLRLRGLHNTLTNFKGVFEGLVQHGALAAREADQQTLVAWIDADSARRDEYGGALPALDALVARRAKTRDRDYVLTTLTSVSPMLKGAQTAVVLAAEREKGSDLLREAEYQERNWERIINAQRRSQASIDPRLDRPVLRWALSHAATLDATQRLDDLDRLVGLTPGLPAKEASAAIDSFLDRLYARTRIHDLDARLALLDSTSAELAASDDAMIQMALALEPLRVAILDADKREAGAELRLRPTYMRALLAKAGGLVAPDANSTLRVAFGTVKGKPGPDGVLWLPFTTLRGIEQKNTGEGEFNAPPREMEAIARLRAAPGSTPYLDPSLHDVPVNFLSNVDLTGGSSGSPTLNARGELVGLVFDGTYDTIVSDYIFDQENARAIHVDIRYVLWTMSDVDGAQHLIEEMMLVP